VPGGGPFADQVRAAQSRWGFDDATAHHLALLAMEQFGRILCALQPGFTPAASPGAIRDALQSGMIPVWMPAPMVLADPTVPPCWDMTSDSLAAWLCAELKAEALLLVKSAPLEPCPPALERLASDGIVDPLLPRFAQAAGVPVHLLSTQAPDALDRLQELIPVH
jgi:aspartokinase-like uncharacterized kinase